jgi:hypothetical protein
MSKGNIKVVLEKRASDIVEREKQVAEEAKEQERIRSLSASSKVSKCSINNFMAFSLILDFASVKFLFKSSLTPRI